MLPRPLVVSALVYLQLPTSIFSLKNSVEHTSPLSCTTAHQHPILSVSREAAHEALSADVDAPRPATRAWPRSPPWPGPA